MGYKDCNFCGARVDMDSVYCNKCGIRLDIEDKAIAQMKDKKEMSVIQKPFGEEYRLFVAFSISGECIYIATSERGYMQLQWLRNFSDQSIILNGYVFDNKEECMQTANKLILLYNPKYNKRLNASALSVKGIATKKNKTQIEVKAFLKEHNIDLVRFNSLYYIDLDKTNYVKKLLSLDDGEKYEKN